MIPEYALKGISFDLWWKFFDIKTDDIDAHLKRCIEHFHSLPDSEEKLWFINSVEGFFVCRNEPIIRPEIEVLKGKRDELQNICATLGPFSVGDDSPSQV